ncbi:pilus assembly protein PilZ [Bacillus lacus]|uniref:Pilus assembly protein PilZ n=1 Tax=Metabacillus lacus TaxID=1983721 RepID=A0A7X2IWF9_9BACI|nr:flagellar brake domain-containing protein [Metabacillus lacus]MRX71021.1 pilus assembly protein PilZ [Metabacillus lacus]
MLNIGDVLLLEQEGEGKQRMKCKIADLDSNYIYIDYPINEESGKTAFLMNDECLYASFTTGEQAYRFTSKVAGRKKEKIPLILLKLPSEEKIERIQRRQFVRIEAALDAAVHSLDGTFGPFTTLTSDISAGGCAIKLNEGHPLGHSREIRLLLALPFKEKVEYIDAKADIIRILKNEKTGTLKAPLHFTEIQESDRQAVLRYCFERQLLLKKKGLLPE